MKKDSADLSVSFFEHTLPTPLILAAGAHTTIIGNIREHVGALAGYGWSGVVAKTVTTKKPLSVRPYLWSTKQYRFQGMQNSGAWFVPWDDETAVMLKRDVEAAHKNGLILLGSVSASTAEETADLAHRVAGAGVDGIEVDISCPSEIKSTSERMHVSDAERDYAVRVISSIKKVYSGPVIPKLSFHTYEIGELARACEKAGAAGIAAINTIQGIVGIDLESGIPVCSGYGGNSYRSGISGPIIKPFGLSAVSKISSECSLPVSGVGGVDDGKSLLEYIMVGAATVQICTAAMWYGFKIGRRILKEVSELMAQHGYGSLKDVRGISLKYFTSGAPEPRPVKAKIDPVKCNKCGVCFVACRDGAYTAIKMGEESFEVDKNLCDGCGLCRQVCPEDAIRLNI